MTENVFLLAGEQAGDRLMRQQALISAVYLGNEQPPTRRQVAAVLQALSDHTQLSRMLSEDVGALAADRPGVGQQADGVGRYLQGIADQLRTGAASPTPARRRTPEQRWPLGQPS